jgi:hypothetical protein
MEFPQVPGRARWPAGRVVQVRRRAGVAALRGEVGGAASLTRFLALSLLAALLPAVAAEAPDFAALERQGAVIGAIRVHTGNIFDLENPEEDLALYRLANRLHPVTRPDVIAHMLLFRSGERVSVQKVNETERLLRSLRIIHDVEIRPAEYRDGVVAIEVTTRDTWSLDVTGSYSRAGGDNKSKFGLRERNLFGTGVGLAIGRSSDADRQGTEMEVAYDQAFDGWTRILFASGRYNDGKRTSFVMDRPFYSFDTRWSARAAWSDEDRIDPIYNAGDLVSEYRHRAKVVDAALGWSPGLVNGWTSRFLAGIAASDDIYRAEPGRLLTVPLPIDHEVRAPYLRYELLEDDFVKVKNHNRIERPEYLGLGFAGYVQVARAMEWLDSGRSAWLYSAGVSDGMLLPTGQKLLGRATLERRIGSTAAPLTQASVAARLYAPRHEKLLFYATFSADHVSGGGVADQLLLGGTQGLRGYPTRYQAGENRVLATVEQRVFSDWYPYRLARIGAAAFFDAGRAWGGPNQNLVNGGWLSDVGVGLRIALDRAAFDNVLHVDVAVPLNRAPGVKGVQFLVKTEFAF